MKTKDSHEYDATCEIRELTGLVVNGYASPLNCLTAGESEIVKFLTKAGYTQLATDFQTLCKECWGKYIPESQ